MAIDITKTMVGKTDQLNAYDLLSGPRTIRIRSAELVKGDQPLALYFDGDEGKPWKPALTVRRILGMVWGLDAEKWVGLHCTIWCDEKVRFGGADVGGIRVSHMEGLTQPRKLNLATARNARGNFTVQPLKVQAKVGSKAEAYRARLLEVAEDPKLRVEDAWAKIDDEMKVELGNGLLDQILAVEQAAEDHVKNDPGAAADALNAQISG
ncbi:hypothetical protein SAMN05444007_103371 [Cribrihabitans marinus]|uniref:Uncharacterized protein n=1 Tax=Cribrihabitans marinus TaxID=1227549 RepID=A0A1H6W582_9RHOB|nr:hypothetical protein [Cribrihabitans marinus]GGH24621.1 hypothetical protein GCM10010973_11240 [Cribrihabitans marinus]SEJ12191.1 hypothetical protein SAMN05444007_103371 [Cribrihabitans marinus]